MRAAAILYADEVELLGLAASMIHSIGLGPKAKKASLEDMLRWSEIVRGESLVTEELRKLIPRIDSRQSARFINASNDPMFAARARKEPPTTPTRCCRPARDRRHMKRR